MQKGMVMEKNYYEDVIEKIKDLIKFKKYSAAIELLKAELNQVYLPQDYEDEFHDLYNEAQSYILEETDSEPVNIMSEEELLALLNGSVEQQFAAINSLEDLNLRNYLEIIQDFLLSNSLAQLKGRMLDLCVSQNINEEFLFKSSEGIISVNPNSLQSVDEMEFITLAFDYFNNHLYKNPSLIQICQIALVEKVYSIYPKVFLIDNLEEICTSVIDEVNEMFDVEAVASLNDFYH